MTERAYLIVEFEADDLPTAVRRMGEFRKRTHQFEDPGTRDVVVRPDNPILTMVPRGGYESLDWIMDRVKQNVRYYRSHHYPRIVPKERI